MQGHRPHSNKICLTIEHITSKKKEDSLQKPIFEGNFQTDSITLWDTVSSQEKSIDSEVDDIFGRCPYFLIVEIKNGKITLPQF